MLLTLTELHAKYGSSDLLNRIIAMARSVASDHKMAGVAARSEIRAAYKHRTYAGAHLLVILVSDDSDADYHNIAETINWCKQVVRAADASLKDDA